MGGNHQTNAFFLRMNTSLRYVCFITSFPDLDLFVGFHAELPSTTQVSCIITITNYALVLNTILFRTRFSSFPLPCLIMASVPIERSGVLRSLPPSPPLLVSAAILAKMTIFRKRTNPDPPPFPPRFARKWQKKNLEEKSEILASREKSGCKKKKATAR